MAWTLIPSGEGFNIVNENGSHLGKIVPNFKRRTYEVQFPGCPQFNWDNGTNDTKAAVGYVRGIERAVTVYGKEVHGK